jgi:hypothetical protein
MILSKTSRKKETHPKGWAFYCPISMFLSSF